MRLEPAPRSTFEKAEGHARGLRNRLQQTPGASSHDRLVAQSLYDELVDALGYVP